MYRVIETNNALILYILKSHSPPEAFKYILNRAALFSIIWPVNRYSKLRKILFLGCIPRSPEEKRGGRIGGRGASPRPPNSPIGEYERNASLSELICILSDVI
jgi:hypothetical protein